MKYFFLLTCVDVKQWSNLVRLGHPRGLYEDVVELVVALGQLDNLVNQIVLESNIFVNNILLDKVNLTKYYRHVGHSAYFNTVVTRPEILRKISILK